MEDKDIRSEEEKIFNEWKKLAEEPERIVVDGIIDIDTWKKQKPGKHILFVLRDKNGGTRPEYQGDFRKELAETGSGWRTWNNAARWGQVLLDSKIEYESLKYLSSGQRGYLLLPFAAMNLMKDYGGNYTNRDDLDKVSESPDICRLLRRQIEVYKPDKIVACGMTSGRHKSSMEILLDIFGKDQKDIQTVPVRQKAYRYFILSLDKKEIPVIEFYHPQVTKTSAYGDKRGHALWSEMFEDMRWIGKVSTSVYAEFYP